MFTKNFKALLSFLVFLAVCIIAALMFMLPSEPDFKVSVILSDINLKIGESKAIDFAFAPNKATVTFSVEDENIAFVSENRVTALTNGTTTLTAVAEFRGETFKTTSEITVSPASESYTLTLEVLEGGRREDDLIIAEQQFVKLDLTVLDEKQNPALYYYRSTPSITIIRDFANIILDVAGSGQIEFYNDALGFKFTIIVEKFEKV